MWEHDTLGAPEKSGVLRAALLALSLIFSGVGLWEWLDRHQSVLSAQIVEQPKVAGESAP